MHMQGRQWEEKPTLQHRVDHLERLVDLLADLGASEDDLAAHEDEKDDLGLDHAVDETREELGLVRAEVVMLGRKTLQADGELDVARTDNVLDLEVGELGVEAELLDDARVLARGKLRIILRLGARDNHLAAGEDERGRLRLADTHDDGSETLGVVLCFACQNRVATTVEDRNHERHLFSLEKSAPSFRLNTYLRIAGMKRDSLQVQTAVQVDRRDNVPERASQPTAPSAQITGEVSYWSVGVMPLGPVEPAPGVAAGVAGVTPVPFVA